MFPLARNRPHFYVSCIQTNKRTLPSVLCATKRAVQSEAKKSSHENLAGIRLYGRLRRNRNRKPTARGGRRERVGTALPSPVAIALTNPLEASYNDNVGQHFSLVSFLYHHFGCNRDFDCGFDIVGI